MIEDTVELFLNEVINMKTHSKAKDPTKEGVRDLNQGAKKKDQHGVFFSFYEVCLRRLDSLCGMASGETCDLEEQLSEIEKHAKKKRQMKVLDQTSQR